MTGSALGEGCEMRGVLRRIVSSVGLGVLFAPLVVAGDMALGGSAAEARCAGVNREVRSTLLDLVYEEPLPGSCNNNGYYQGRFVLTRGQGTPYVYIQNNGAWRSYTGSSNNTWDDYAYADSNSNSWITLCYLVSLTGDRYCGWGNNLLYYPP